MAVAIDMGGTRAAPGAKRRGAPFVGAHAAPFIAPALGVLCVANVLPLLWSIGVSFFHFRADRLGKVRKQLPDSWTPKLPSPPVLRGRGA